MKTISRAEGEVASFSKKCSYLIIFSKMTAVFSANLMIIGFCGLYGNPNKIKTQQGKTIKTITLTTF